MTGDIVIPERIMKMVDMLENDDDVQKVYHNIEYDEAFLN
jgi:transcriptional/translational regulatory protein YebC/TACO1